MKKILIISAKTYSELEAFAARVHSHPAAIAEALLRAGLEDANQVPAAQWPRPVETRTHE